MGPVVSRGVPRAPRYSGAPRLRQIIVTGLLPSLDGLSSHVHDTLARAISVSATPGRSLVWAFPPSLAATDGIEISFFSCSYLDVSVHCVRLCTLCIRMQIPLRVGFPIQRSQDHSLVTSSPELIAGSHVFHRLLTPRHPPHALNSLITPTSNRSVRHRPPANGFLQSPTIGNALRSKEVV